MTNASETAVCNLGSLNLGRMMVDGKFDFERLRANVALAIRQLDRVIDLNYYPIPTAADVEPQVAAGGPGADGPAGRVLPAAAAVRRARGARAVEEDLRGDLLRGAERLVRPGRAERRRTRPSRTRGRRGASSSSTRGA